MLQIGDRVKHSFLDEGTVIAISDGFHLKREVLVRWDFDFLGQRWCGELAVTRIGESKPTGVVVEMAALIPQRTRCITCKRDIPSGWAYCDPCFMLEPFIRPMPSRPLAP